MTNFNLRDFLTENKLTTLSRMIEAISSSQVSMVGPKKIKEWYSSLSNEEKNNLSLHIQAYRESSDDPELASFLTDHRFDLFYPLTDDAEFYIEDESIDDFLDVFETIEEQKEGVETGLDHSENLDNGIERSDLISKLGISSEEVEFLSTEDLEDLYASTFVNENDIEENLEPTTSEELTDPSHYLTMEGPDNIIKEFEKEVSRITLEYKINKLKEIVEAFDLKINSLEEDSELAGYVSTSKLKEMKRTVSKLRSINEKYLKEYDKKYNKEEN